MGRPRLRTDDLRERVLDGAVHLVADHGPSALTTRAVARAPALPWPQCMSSSEESAASSERSSSRASDRLAASVGSLPVAPDPEAGILDLAQAFRTFAVEHGELYDVMFSRPYADFQPEPDDLTGYRTTDVPSDHASMLSSISRPIAPSERTLQLPSPPHSMGLCAWNSPASSEAAHFDRAALANNSACDRTRPPFVVERDESVGAFSSTSPCGSRFGSSLRLPTVSAFHLAPEQHGEDPSPAAGRFEDDAATLDAKRPNHHRPSRSICDIGPWPDGADARAPHAKCQARTGATVSIMNRARTRPLPRGRYIVVHRTPVDSTKPKPDIASGHATEQELGSEAGCQRPRAGVVPSEVLEQPVEHRGERVESSLDSRSKK